MQAEQPVRSRSHPLVKRLRALRERAFPEGGLMLLEGPKLVLEALRAGVELVEAAASARAVERPGGAEALTAMEDNGVPVRLLADDVLEAVSELRTSQGLLAIGQRPRPEPEALFAGLAPLVVVAVGVQDPGNLGGLLRSAEAAGASGAILTTGCADPFSWKALRGSMGSAFRLPLLAGLSAEDALALLRARGVRLAATAADAPTSYAEADLRGALALLVGSEGSGLPEVLEAAADLRLRIPMAGEVESLNAGVAAGVLLFEAARQRRAP
jgi:TrmH family RNA methyltransferase